MIYNPITISRYYDISKTIRLRGGFKTESLVGHITRRASSPPSPSPSFSFPPFSLLSSSPFPPSLLSPALRFPSLPLLSLPPFPLPSP